MSRPLLEIHGQVFVKARGKYGFFAENARDFCHNARGKFRNDGRENLALARETFWKCTREQAKMLVTNFTKLYVSDILVCLEKKNTDP